MCCRHNVEVKALGLKAGAIVPYRKLIPAQANFRFYH